MSPRLFHIFVPVVIFAYPVLQIIAITYSRGTLRWITMLPLPLAAWLFWGFVQFRQGAPNTNLYPILPIFLCPMMDAFLVGCIIAEWSMRMARKESN
jgi:hypothetical protein